jgi:hypothetical protein
MESELNSLDFIKPKSINYYRFDKKNPDQNIWKYRTMFDKDEDAYKKLINKNKSEFSLSIK